MKLPNKPKVLAATYNPVSNTKMISFLVDFPTVLLAELRTHRILTQGSLYEHSELVDFNLSANSARAIPHNKYLEKVLNNPFIPIWTKQQKGMSGEICTKQESDIASSIWKRTLKGTTIKIAGDIKGVGEIGVKHQYEYLLKKGVHKQNANRLLAPFAYTTCIISGTEWDNFFELRCPKYYYEPENMYFNSKKAYINKFNSCFNDNLDETVVDWQSINKSTAQPEFQVVSELLYDLYQEADWKESKYHIPFEEDIKSLYDYELKKYTYNIFDYYDKLMLISASMCAKLSYNTQENEDTLEKHLERANMLIEHKHQEPFSHQAVAMDSTEYNSMFKILRAVNINGVKSLKVDLGKCWNLTGFISQRYILENF